MAYYPPPPPLLPLNLTSVEEFTNALKRSPIWSKVLENNWIMLSQPAKRSYIRWFYSDRTRPLSDVWNDDSAGATVNDSTLIEYFEKFTKESLKGGSRRHRRPSRKYKKSKRVFRKKSRSTRRR